MRSEIGLKSTNSTGFPSFTFSFTHHTLYILLLLLLLLLLPFSPPPPPISLIDPAFAAKFYPKLMEFYCSPPFPGKTFTSICKVRARAKAEGLGLEEKGWGTIIMVGQDFS